MTCLNHVSEGITDGVNAILCAHVMSISADPDIHLYICIFTFGFNGKCFIRSQPGLRCGAGPWRPSSSSCVCRSSTWKQRPTCCPSTNSTRRSACCALTSSTGLCFSLFSSHTYTVRVQVCCCCTIFYTNDVKVNEMPWSLGASCSSVLIREAIALVKARLPADEPLLKELYTCWAAVLEKDGHFSAAAKWWEVKRRYLVFCLTLRLKLLLKCIKIALQPLNRASSPSFLAADASFDAAKVIARKNDVVSLRTAANLARISGEAALAQSLALRCAKDLAAARDWVGAQEVLSSQDGLLVSCPHLILGSEHWASICSHHRNNRDSNPPQGHRLHLCVAELLAAMLGDSEVSPAASCVSSHPWASPGERHISVMDRVRDVWEEQFTVSHQSVGALLQELKSAESPTPTANTPLRQVQLPFIMHTGSDSCTSFIEDVKSGNLFEAKNWKNTKGYSLLIDLGSNLLQTVLSICVSVCRSCCTRPSIWPVPCWAGYCRMTISWWRSCGKWRPGWERPGTSVSLQTSAGCCSQMVFLITAVKYFFFYLSYHWDRIRANWHFSQCLK